MLLLLVLNKIVKLTPLRKMAAGGVLTAFSYCFAGFLEVISFMYHILAKPL
jgi:hypothetical protein